MGAMVDFSGWTCSDENMERMRNDWKYRWSIHWRRAKRAVQYKRWSHFCWFNIRGLIFNEKRTF